MSETHTGLNGRTEDNDKIRPQDLQRESGTNQQQPLPNENLQNQPYSSKKTLDPSNQQHQWNDTDPQAGVSAGVTQGHADPQQPKHGHGAEGSSSTGLPQS